MATEKISIKTYDGQEVIFYPNSHQYKLNGKNLLSPSGIVGKLDKSRQLMSWVKKEAEAKAETLFLETETYSKFAIMELVRVALNAHLEKLEKAKDVGDEIHDFAENYAYLQVMGETLPTKEDVQLYEDNEQVRQGKLAFLDFIATYNVKFINVEQYVFSKAVPEATYSGKFDALVELNGKRCLIDWKSSKGVYTSQKYQLAGYDLALQEEISHYLKVGDLEKANSMMYESIAIIHIDKNTGIPVLHELSEEERADCRSAFVSLAIINVVEKKLDTWGK